MVVMGIEEHGSYKEVICDDKSYEAKAVIIATGVNTENWV